MPHVLGGRIECGDRRIGKRNRFLHRFIHSRTMGQVVDVRCLQQGLHGNGTSIRCQGIDDLAGRLDQSLGGLVLSAKQLGLQSVRRVVAPEGDAALVLALQALQLGLRRIHWQGAFDGFRQHETQFDQVHRRRQDIGRDVLGDEGLRRSITRLVRAPKGNESHHGGGGQCCRGEGGQHRAQSHRAALARLERVWVCHGQVDASLLLSPRQIRGAIFCISDAHACQQYRTCIGGL